MNTTVYVLLPVYNRREVTRRFLQSLVRQETVTWRLVLLDDGSTDGTATMVSELIPKAIILRGNGDWWWAGAVAAGLNWLEEQKAPGNEMVFIANDDIEFGPDFFKRAIQLVGENPHTLVSACCYGRQSGKFLEQGITIDWRRFSFTAATSDSDISCLATRGVFGRVSDFLSIGGLHPRILKHYLADCEFTLRAARKGLRLLCSSELVMIVDEETTGYHSFRGANWVRFTQVLFSLKCPQNPGAWINFIMLACPWRWKIGNIARVLLKAGHQLITRRL